MTDDKLFQNYEGKIFHNNLHGSGFYYIENDNQRTFYDALFYTNKLEGYGQVFYDDATNFQGLFKENRRFGPGVFTYSNFTQDVGIWHGHSLLRLSTEVMPGSVPRLAETAVGKAKLLQYKYLVPVCYQSPDIATEILKSLNSSDSVLERAQELYNMDIREQTSKFFNKIEFDTNFFIELDCFIDVLETVEENEDLMAAEEEEETVDSFEYNFNRVYELARKCEEIGKKYRQLRDIQRNLSGMQQICTHCCYPNRFFNGSEEHEGEGIEEYHGKWSATDGATLELKRSHNTEESSFVSFMSSTNRGSAAANVGYFDGDAVNPAENSTVDQILSYCVCEDDRSLNDLQFLENRLINVTKESEFYGTILLNLQQKLAAEVNRKNSTSSKIKTKKINITDVCAWNNEETSMNILKHCFLHRKSERMINFNITTILSANRKEFGEPGEHEQLCIDFLTYCSSGNKNSVIQSLNDKINPNLSDAKGNTGLFFAASRDQVEIIAILANYGAKLDQLNDEGLTPLTLCFLRYLAVKYKCSSWEKAFLLESQTVDDKSLDKFIWYPVKSFLSLTSPAFREIVRDSEHNWVEVLTNTRLKEIFQPSDRSPQRDNTNCYLFETRTKTTRPKTPKKVQKTTVSPDKDTEGGTKLNSIQFTITTLLAYGANPNMGEVPFPPLYLSIYTENAQLVQWLLESGADCDTTFSEAQLSYLHIIASLNCSSENVKICKLLLDFNCNPNQKTSSEYWFDEKKVILGKNFSEEFVTDRGKNALHHLATRRDFVDDTSNYFHDIAQALILNNLDLNDTYLGHTPLSLAVLMGNAHLTKSLVESPTLNPYAHLGYNMGNVLTIFCLNKYEQVLPAEECKAMLTLLFNSNVNPLFPIMEYENAIDFAEKCNISDSVKNTRDKASKSKSKPKSKSKGKKGIPFLRNILEHLKDIARQTIIKYQQLRITEILYNFTEENMLDEEIAKIITEFLTPQICSEKIRTIFNNNLIPEGRFEEDLCTQLFQFVDIHKRKVKPEKIKKEKNKKKGKVIETESTHTSQFLSPEQLENLVDAIHPTPQHAEICKLYIFEPGLEKDTSIYHVCFHCLKKTSKQLQLCPRCQIIYFCSEECNKQNLKLKTQHTCNLQFYKNDKLDQDDSNSLLIMEDRTRRSCEDRFNRKMQELADQKIKEIIEGWKRDTNGTKFMHLDILKIFKAYKLPIKQDLEVIFSTKYSSVSHSETNSYSEYLNSRVSIKNLQNQLQKLQQYYRPSTDSYKQQLCSNSYKSISRLSTVTHVPSTNEKAAKKPKRKESTLKEKHKCTCGENGEDTKQASVVPQRNALSMFEYLNPGKRVLDAKTITKKLRRIPKKYQQFMEMLGKCFPDTDTSFWLLPYVCFSEGQLYYKFFDKDIFTESYSLL